MKRHLDTDIVIAYLRGNQNIAVHVVPNRGSIVATIREWLGYL